MSYLSSLDDKCDTLGSSLVIFLGIVRFVSLRSSQLYHWCHNQSFSISLESLFFSPLSSCIGHFIYFFNDVVAPDIAATLKIILDYEKRTDIWHLVFLGEKVLFKESPPSIMVTRNPNWSTEILWYGIGYVKGKILSPLKRPAWGRLHCWFCLKLLNIYWFMLWWYTCNISDSSASEYSSSNNSNSGVGKNS